MARVLVIDDDPLLRRLLTKSLALAGHEVHEAEDGRDGLAAITAWTPDLVLCDVNMPVMTGFELLATVRASPNGADLPFIFLSGLSERADLIAGRRLGADDFLTKPVDIDLMMASVEARLERNTMRQRQIAHVTLHDPLTGLPNQQYLTDLLQRRWPQLNIVHIDIDQFRRANALFGRSGGDAAMVSLARRLADDLDADETIARAGDDEFMLATPNHDLATRAARLTDLLRPPVDLGQGQLGFTASIGYAGAHQARDVAELVSQAELAGRSAKTAGGNRVRAFSAELAIGAARQVAIEIDLVQALTRGELYQLYQPKVDLLSRRIVGAEALSRWLSPILGEVAPMEFIGSAEQTGLIKDIGLWALETSCRQARAWEIAGLGRLQVAVNLSPRQFDMPGLVDEIARVIAASGADPALVELEVTESVLIDDGRRAIDVLKEIRALGVSIAVDDFGTGFSSLSYLAQFPVDTLKIDKAFLRDVPGQNANEKIVDSVLDLAHRLDLKVVAEGVETEAQVSYLTQRGCDLAQGFYFGEPMTASVFGERLCAELR